MDVSKIPLLKSNPYQNSSSCKLKQTQEVEYQGRTFRIHIYEKSHTMLWKMQKGLQASLATILTLFIGLAFKSVQRLWSQALSGKEIKFIRFPSFGGFANDGHSCYINSVLQCAKTLKDFWRYLRQPLAQKGNESAERFQLRQQIRQTIHDFLSVSFS